MKSFINSTLRSLGYQLIRAQQEPNQAPSSQICDLTEEQQQIIASAQPFTMTSVERMAALVGAVGYISANRIPGDIAECGVWRGGSMMTVAMTLMSMGDTSRSLYLYDTYEGMSAPTDEDKSIAGTMAEDELRAEPKGTGIWCYASLEDVKANLRSTGYPEDKIHFIKGKVEDTIPLNLPGNLALLRLDTDWYESTRHELIHLYPLLRRNGVLMIDDYGHWQGAKKAVDEYFSESGVPVYFHRVDYTGRIIMRTVN